MLMQGKETSDTNFLYVSSAFMKFLAAQGYLEDDEATQRFMAASCVPFLPKHPFPPQEGDRLR